METVKTQIVVTTTPADIPLPAEYAALGLTTGYNPVTLDEARLYITGMSGEGKSTFISSIPDSWVIDFETGVGGIPGRKGAYFNLAEAAKTTKKSKYEIFRTIFEKLIADGVAGRH
ncbi:hypothetical protein LCGC14_1912400, partial [marine sediment metagenome]